MTSHDISHDCVHETNIASPIQIVHARQIYNDHAGNWYEINAPDLN